MNKVLAYLNLISTSKSSSGLIISFVYIILLIISIFLIYFIIKIASWLIKKIKGKSHS